MTAPSPDAQRALRRRRKHERQAVIFGSLIAALALAGLGATAVYTGAMEASFLSRDFTSPPPEAVVEIPDPPCPPDETLPPSYDTIEVTVYNASGRVGLAGQTANDLGERGFVVLGTDNYPIAIETAARISFGEAGIAAAYTLAAQMSSVALIMDTREDATVDLVLGEDFIGLLDPSLIPLDPSMPLVGTDSCIPIEEARALAVPGPTAAPDPEDGDGETDGGDASEEEGEDAATDG